MTLLIAAYSASSILTFMIAISLLSSRASTPQCARILGCNYLLFCLLNLLAVMALTGLWPQATYIRGTLAMLLGPAMYFYFDNVLMQRNSKSKSVFGLHICPALVLILLVFTFLPNAADVAIILSFMAYLSYAGYQYLKQYLILTKLRARSEAPNLQALNWLGVLLSVLAVNLVVELGVAYEIANKTPLQDSLSLKIGSLFFLGFHIVTLILVLTRAPLIEWMHELKMLIIDTLEQQLSASEAENQDQALLEIYQNWRTLVAKEELYLTENSLPLSRSAKRLGVPARQLSQAINKLYGASYTQYLNDIRVEKAKSLLQKNTDLPITEVFLSAGFATKSHFHREFSRCTGMTPSEFRTLNR